MPLEIARRGGRRGRLLVHCCRGVWLHYVGRVPTSCLASLVGLAIMGHVASGLAAASVDVRAGGLAAGRVASGLAAASIGVRAGGLASACVAGGLAATSIDALAGGGAPACLAHG